MVSLFVVMGAFAARGQSDLILFASSPGDYIGGGQTYQTFDTSSFSGSGGAVTASAFGFGFGFVAPGQESLVVGTYVNARRAPFRGSSPGIDISGNGRGCNTECGSFQILELHTDGSGHFDRLWLKFTNSCECFGALMTGEIRYHSQLALIPVPISIVKQPVNQTVVVGNGAVFNVGVSGSLPFAYSWSFNGVPLPGETTDTLVLNNVQPGQAGLYSVAVTNAFGATNSTAARLSVVANPVCINPPAGITHWWPGEGSALDLVGSGAASLGGGASFAPGKVGRAFSFTNGVGFVLVPNSPDLDFGANDFSIELWAQFKTLGGSRALIAKDEGPGQTSKWIFWLNNGQLEFSFAGIDLGGGSFAPVLDHWHHLAVTRGGSLFSFYVDGSLISSGTSTTPIPVVNAPVTLGQAEGLYYMGGLEDEVAIYNRALSGDEVRAVFEADTAGKCRAPMAPVLVTQPQSITTFIGATVNFSVFAAGSPLPTYRWLFNGTNISGAKDSTLTLTNVQASQAGNYSVVVSNSQGSTNSASATLTLLTPDSCLPPASGIAGWWAGDGNVGDSAGSSTGALTGAAIYVPGKVGLAFSLTNAGSYVSIPDQTAAVTGTADFTIELWAQFATVGGTRAFISKDEGPGAQNKWIFWLNNGQLQFLFGQATAYTVGSGNFAPTLNHWHHVAVTRSGSLFTFYVDGVVNSSGASSATIPTINAPITIGQAEGGYFMAGLEDEVALYSRALSAEDIQAVFQADSGGKCRPTTIPAVVTQPQSQPAYVGADVGFAVLAAGNPPPLCQWQFNGVNIPGATNLSLVLTNIQLSQAGGYSALLSNSRGSTSSATATLNVLSLGACLPSPPLMLSWWAGDANALDTMGTNNGTLSGGATFVPGKVGLAFSFTNGTGYAAFPDAPSQAFGSNDFTIELWALFPTIGGNRAFIAKDEGSGAASKWIFWLSNGQLQFQFGQASANIVGSGAFAPILNHWHHVAVTRAGSVFAFYVDGSLSSIAVNGAPIPPINAPITIGQAEGANFMGGLEDEISIYNRALSAGEILSIYQADGVGKCRLPVAPSVIGQPQSVTVFPGANVNFNVVAAGSPLPSYQWQFNGTNIPGATGGSLLLTNVQPTQTGGYSALVSNALGATNSAAATLTVLSAGACLPVPSGILSWWAGDGTAGDAVGLNQGSLAGGATYAPGKSGLCFSFTSGSGYVSIPDRPNQAFGANDFAIELWAQFTTVGGTRALISKDEGVGAASKWIFWLNNGQLQFQYGQNTANIVGTGAFTPVLNKWHHLAVSRSGSLFSFYVDGALNSSGLSTAAIPAIAAPITIGQAEGLYFMGGLEDEVTIYNRSLSAADINSIYTAGSTGKCRSQTPPVFINQPQSAQSFAGNNVAFNALAAGNPPPAYQWLFNGVALAGETNLTLSLTNIQPSQAGSYSVQVMNSLGTTNSVNAVLSIFGAGSCLPAPAGLSSWWAGDGNAVDSIGLNGGSLANGASYAVGKVGLGFSFTNGSGYVSIPDRPSQAFGANDFSIELWAQFTSLGGNRAFISKDEGAGAFNKWIFWLNNGQLQFLFGQATSFVVGSGSFTPVLNQWHHVAVTRSGSLFSFYVDGVLNSTGLSSAAIPGIAAPITIGQAEGGYYQGGLEDEVCIYGRALSAGEVMAIYQAGADGKCRNAVAPFVVAQPQSLSLFVGATASFNVLPAGNPAPGCQWQFNGVNIPGATNRTLVLTNIQLTNAGSYSASIANSQGSTNSAPALLTVYSTGSCLPPPSGIVSWWGGDGSANDGVGLNQGALAGGAGYAPGKAGVAFAFTNGNGYVTIPDRPNQALGANDFTIELWAQFTSLGGSRAFISKDEGSGATRKWIFWLNNGQLQFLFGQASSITVGSGAFTPILNRWHHVAVTRLGSVFSFYVDGVLNSVAQSTAAIPTVSAPLTIGQAEGTYFMGGLEDEVTIYSRALGAAELQAIYQADAAGKCRSQTSPAILTQPKDQTVYVGGNTSLGVLAYGNPAPAYQWLLNGTNLPNATNSILVLTNLQVLQGGTYSVQVSNALGNTNSSGALLTVYVPTCSTPSSSLLGWWGGEGNALDSGGTNHGVLVSGVNFAPGLVGTAFQLNGTNAYVEVSNRPQLNPTNKLTLEAWVYPVAFGTGILPIIKKAGEGPQSLHGYTLEATANGALMAVYLGGGTGWVQSPLAPLQLNRWTHVAGVFDGAKISIYVDGMLVGTPTSAVGSIAPSGNPLQIGHDPADSARFFTGLIDEASVYGSALSAPEIKSIFLSAYAGKCALPLGPSFAFQPGNQSVIAGSTTTLNTLAGGSLPLTYQWHLDGADIPASVNPTATNANLILTNVSPLQAGTYSVTVSNNLGTIQSTNAVLTLLFPPAIILQPASLSAIPGCSVSFSGLASGNAPLRYQWQKSGTNLPLQTNQTLVLLNLQTNDYAAYALVVTNAYGSITSAVATVSQDHPPVPGHTVAYRYASGGLKLEVSEVLRDAYDVDGDPLSISLTGTSTIAGGSVSLAGGSLFYVPPAGYADADAFTYLLSDGNCGGIATGVVLLLVRTDSSPTSHLTLHQDGNGLMQLLFDGVPGKTYRVQASDSLSVPNWQDVGTRTADQFGKFGFTDAPGTNSAARYYRSVSP